MSKSLIAYYSRSGNTALVAQKIQRLTGADLFEIATSQPYPRDYIETTRIAKKELREGARPILANDVGNMNQYDIIYLGYPNWWDTFPMAVATFLESFDFSEKTIIPFCTHGGGGMGSGEDDIQKLCPRAEVKKGLALPGSTVNNSDEVIQSWLEKFSMV